MENAFYSTQKNVNAKLFQDNVVKAVKKIFLARLNIKNGMLQVFLHYNCKTCFDKMVGTNLIFEVIPTARLAGNLLLYFTFTARLGRSLNLYLFTFYRIQEVYGIR